MRLPWIVALASAFASAAKIALLFAQLFGASKMKWMHFMNTS